MNRKTVLITGAAKRIGRALALAFAKNNYDCIIHYHTSQKDAENVVAEISHMGPCAMAIPADLADSGAVQSLFTQAQKSMGPIDVLINNAAIFERDTLNHIDAEMFLRHSKINTLAPMLLTQAMYAQNIAQGCVINILDHALFQRPRGYTSYITSKAALWHATMLAAKQFYPKLRVNALAPGIILPPHADEANPAWRQDYQDPLLDHTENIDDIVGGCMHIVNNPALNGQLIPIDSGRHLPSAGIMKPKA